MNVYRHAFWMRCPANGRWIRYRLTIRTDRMVMVEDLKAACRSRRSGYHEPMADDLFARFGGHQHLVARHHGVLITTVRP